MFTNNSHNILYYTLLDPNLVHQSLNSIWMNPFPSCIKVARETDWFIWLKEERVIAARLSCFNNKCPKYRKVSLQSAKVSSPYSWGVGKCWRMMEHGVLHVSFFHLLSSLKSDILQILVSNMQHAPNLLKQIRKRPSKNTEVNSINSCVFQDKHSKQIYGTPHTPHLSTPTPDPPVIALAWR